MDGLGMPDLAPVSTRSVSSSRQPSGPSALRFAVEPPTPQDTSGELENPLSLSLSRIASSLNSGSALEKKLSRNSTASPATVSKTLSDPDLKRAIHEDGSDEDGNVARAGRAMKGFLGRLRTKRHASEERSIDEVRLDGHERAELMIRTI